MNELSIIERDGIAAVDSREVAEFVGKRHDHLCRDIAGYITHLQADPNFGVSDFFIPTEYKDSTGRTLPNYLITRKGCEMVANKLTGEKGVIFTAKYIERFHQYEDALRLQLPQDYPAALRALADSFEQNQQLQKRARLDAPKVAYCDAVLNAEGLVSVTQIAKDFGKSAVWLNKELAAMGVQFNRKGQWFLYAKFAENGYTASKTQTYVGSNGEVLTKLHTYWTQRGRAFIVAELAKRGVLPIGAGAAAETAAEEAATA